MMSTAAARESESGWVPAAQSVHAKFLSGGGPAAGGGHIGSASVIVCTQRHTPANVPLHSLVHAHQMADGGQWSSACFPLSASSPPTSYRANDMCAVDHLRFVSRSHVVESIHLAFPQLSKRRVCTLRFLSTFHTNNIFDEFLLIIIVIICL